MSTEFVRCSPDIETLDPKLEAREVDGGIDIRA